MYNTKSLITSLFEGGFDSNSIHKISTILNKDVTTNILSELESEKTHKLAVSNFNKTLLTQNKELSTLRGKIVEYERIYSIQNHDRSSNPWRGNPSIGILDELPDNVSIMNDACDRVTGEIVVPNGGEQLFVDLPHSTPYVRDIDDNDVNELVESAEYKAAVTEAIERKHRAVSAKRRTVESEKRKADLETNGINLTGIIKGYERQEIVAKEDVKATPIKNKISKDKPKKVVKKKVNKTPTKKRVTKAVKKKIVKK